MNKNKIILSTIASLCLYGSLNAATFDFDNATPNFGNSISSSIDGVTLTVTSTSTIYKATFGIGTDTGIMLNNANANNLTFTFDKAINLTSLQYITPVTPGANSFILNPTGGTGNNALTIYQQDWNLQDLNTNWNGITGFVIDESTNTALSRIAFDNFVFTLANTKTYLDSAVLANAESNTKRSAQTLQNIKDNGSYTAMSSVFTALDNVSTDSQKAQKIEETTPQTATSSVSASNHVAQGISNIVTQRQNVNLGAGINSGDEMFVEKNIWFKPFGSIGKQNDKDGINGFDINTYGLAFGIDGEYEENQTFGLGFFYTNANVEVNNVQQSSDLDVFSLVAYGSNPIIDNKTKLMYQLGYAIQKNDSSRFVSLTSDTATSKYTSKTASVDLKVLRDYRVSEDLLLQPMISSTYRHFSNPSYSETGASALNLDVQKFTTTELLVGLGTMAHYKLNETSKIIANANVDYDLHDRTTTVTSSYQGASGVTFDTDGIDNGRWSYDVGVAYENQIDDLSNINFSYNYQGKGSDYSNNVISAKYTYKF